MSNRCVFPLLALLAAAPAAAQAPALDAAQALERAREMTAMPSADCPRNPFDPDEILVCGRDESARQRLPLPAERGPREGPRGATGEVAAASAAPIRSHGCSVMQGGEICSGGISVLAAVPLLVKGVITLIDPEAELAPPPRIPEP